MPAADAAAGAGGPPAAVDVLATIAHHRTQGVDLGGRVVLRTPERPDHGPGNAVHLGTAAAPDRDAVLAGLADARERAGRPEVVPRVVARRDDEVATSLADDPGLRVRATDVLVLPDPARAAARVSPRGDLRLDAPSDDRQWHGVVVLHRHGALEATDRQARARGGRDDLLRWRVAGRRRQRDEGRARVLVATRFGTPVGAGVLLWAPGVAVAPGSAGLAVVDDVVVHPAHRRLGVARTLVAALVGAHVDDFPVAQVATVAPAALSPALARHGWHRHDRLLVVEDHRRTG